MIDPDYLREELSEWSEFYDLTQDEADTLSALDDDTLQEAMMGCASDEFWHIMDIVRSRAIRALAAEYLTTSL